MGTDKTNIDNVSNSKNESKSIASQMSSASVSDQLSTQFVNNKSIVSTQERLQMMANESVQVNQFRDFQDMADKSSLSEQVSQFKLKDSLSTTEDSIEDTNDTSVQLKLENTSVNNGQSFNRFQGAIIAYANALNAHVESARNMIATKFFVHVPAIDGYMQLFCKNFDLTSNQFIEGNAMPRQAGYWIESYVTKIARPSAGGGLDVILQAKRGNSRPDVILQYQGRDVAWLDITSTVSEGHIYDKNSEGWSTTPYVTEVTYEGLKINQLNTVAIPDASSLDISALLENAKAAYAKQLEWETSVIDKYGMQFGDLMHKAYYYVKNSDVKHEDAMDLDEEQATTLYSPFEEGNKYEKLALSFVNDITERPMDGRELAAVMMYWNGMISRYEERFAMNLSPMLHLPGKEHLGLSWVDDASSSDGEPLIRDLFPV